MTSLKRDRIGRRIILGTQFPQAHSELDDWLKAEREILGPIQVEVGESGEFVNVLASLPGYRSSQVATGIDPRWLVIFGCHESNEGEEKGGIVRPLDPHSACRR